MDIIKQYLALCWFNVSPLELPRSTAFFKNNLIFSLLVFFFIQFNMTDEIESITEVVLETLLNLGFIALTLWLNKNMHTFIQVGSAILFCENVVAALIIPIMFWATVAEDWLGYGMLGIMVLWNWAMVGIIFKQALNITTLAGLIMSLFYLLFSFGGGFALNSVVSG
ncbi:hypothetical protein IVG45_21045 [Methylomonas sp. LL1]|uniref:hypothetical protein n=1 Tax=Methylomonas sp. LL1 TaxID=2785785 RepID=UPI0018C3F655|nr:hypothetical protein [Methylomonas sp. LL1]QPK63260.1 hypothetical protein IVG45_21045 [Methylomonas sp. LL1]